MDNLTPNQKPNRKGQIIAFVAGLAFMALLAFVLKSGVFKYRQEATNNAATPQNKIQVVASFYPLADFAKNVGGDYVTVTNITPAGAEPHDYEPTPQDIAKAYNSKVFIFNGNGVDGWADKIQSDLEGKGVKVVKISDHLDSLKKNAQDEEGGQYDPHFWLDPVNVEKEADFIADALAQIDPAHKDAYNQNRDNFKKKLSDLDQEYKTGLTSCQLRTIVTSHNAFNYLANRYNLTTLYILGLSPDEEPSPKAIADVANTAKQKGIKYIFFETLVSPKLSETIANEIGAKTLVLNPIEGLTDEEIAQGKNYISVMKDNLANLRTALQCQ